MYMCIGYILVCAGVCVCMYVCMYVYVCTVGVSLMYLMNNDWTIIGQQLDGAPMTMTMTMTITITITTKFMTMTTIIIIIRTSTRQLLVQVQVQLLEHTCRMSSFVPVSLTSRFVNTCCGWTSFTVAKVRSSLFAC